MIPEPFITKKHTNLTTKLSTLTRSNLEKANGLTSRIEERNADYSTNTADRDWYRFDAEAGKVYGVELFDVSPSLAKSTGDGCERNYNYLGLGLLVLDPSGSSVVRQCKPSGSGAVHHIVELQVRESGPYYIGVFPNVRGKSGNYSIRVMPK